MTIPQGALVVAVVVTWRTPEMTRQLLHHLTSRWPEMPVVLVECGPERHETQGLGTLVVVMRSGNLGYSGGNNLGVNKALEMGATHVLVLNSDTFPLWGCVEKLLRALEDHPDAGVSGGTLVRWHAGSGPECNSGTSFDWATGETAPSPVGGPVGPVGPVDFPCGALLLFRARALREVGGFDSAFFLFYEEIDWAERARRLGYLIISSSEARALHLGSKTVTHAPRAIAFYRTRNRLVVLRRYGREHKESLRLSRELAYAIRLLAGHVLRGRFWALAPVALGTAQGLVNRLNVDDEPTVALCQQRWETRDQAWRPKDRLTRRAPWRRWNRSQQARKESFVLLTASSGLGGGIERYVGELERALRNRSDRVVRLDLYRPGHHGLAAKVRFVVRVPLALCWLRPVCVFVMHKDLFTFAGRLCRLARLASIGWIYGAEVFWPPHRSDTARGARHLDTLVAISNYTAKQLASALPSPQVVPIIRPALGPDWWSLLRTVKENKADHPCLVAVARMHGAAASKGIGTVIDLAVALKGEFPDLECRIIGAGPALEQYRQRLRDQGHEEFCHLLGCLSDEEMVRELKYAWIFVLPSRLQPPAQGEGFGIVYIEAASAGLPVVGSTDGGASEAVAHGLNGFAIDPRDLSAQVEACRRLLRQPELRTRMGAAGVEWARSDFGPDRFGADIESLIDATCTQHLRPHP